MRCLPLLLLLGLPGCWLTSAEVQERLDDTAADSEEGDDDDDTSEDALDLDEVRFATGDTGNSGTTTGAGR